MDGSNYKSSNIIMNSGEVSVIVGGGVSIQENLPAKVENSTITINGGTVLGSVIGGGYLYSEVTNSNIIVNNGNVAAVGGGGVASVTVNGVYYSIGTEEAPQLSPNRTENVSVTINNGTINSPKLNYGLVYGGGQGYSYVGNANLIINGGDMSKAYVTAGGSNGYTGKSNVEINGGDINIYQSVNRGIVEEAVTKVTGGNIQKFYVGGETEDTSVTGTINKVEVALLDGTVNVLDAGKSNSQPIVLDQSNYNVLKTDDVEILNDNISSEEIEITYEISVTPQSMRITENESQKIDVIIKTIPTGYDRFFNNVNYKSSNEEIATVTDDGVVTGIKKGTTTITVSLLEEESSMNVTVKPVEDYTCLWLFLSLLILVLLLFMFIIMDVFG